MLRNPIQQSSSIIVRLGGLLPWQLIGMSVREESWLRFIIKQSRKSITCLPIFVSDGI